MILIGDVLISDEVLDRYFLCNLAKCKGACCWEGDYGAPLEADEISQIKEILPIILEYLPENSKALLAKHGISKAYAPEKFEGTLLHENGACVFLFKDEDGIAKCSFEQANQDGLTEFRKPISCHLYPVRRTVNKTQDFEALNYDHWDICNAACQLGKDMNLPLFRFVKDALIRLYGQEFYDQLNQYYIDKHEKKPNL